MPGDFAAEWFSSEEAIAHIRACIWYQKDATPSLMRLSMAARTGFLQRALEEGSVPARGPFRSPHELPAHVRLHWPDDADIPRAFWPGSVWDGRSGFRNRSSSEFLPWFEVPKKELYDLWPEADRVPMPAPFGVDWPPLQDVIEAMTQRLDVSREGAYRRLNDGWQEEKIKASKGRGSHDMYIFDEWERADPNALRRADAQWNDEFSATETNGGREAIVLHGEDVIALWPRLVLTEFGEIAPPITGWTGTRAPEPSAPVPTRAPEGGVRAPSGSNMSWADARRCLPGFLTERSARAQASGEKFNQVVARREAEAHFGRRIPRRAFRETYRAAGLKRPGGRPRKTPPAEIPPKK